MPKGSVIEIDMFVYSTGTYELILRYESGAHRTCTGTSKAAVLAKLPKEFRNYETNGDFFLKKNREGTRVYGEWWEKVGK